MSTDPEELFPPRAGGMVDAARKKAAADADQAAAAAAAPPAPPAKKPIPVIQPAGALARARTFSIATGNSNPIVELLGRDDNRRYAVVMTLDEPVVLAFSQQAADDPRNPVNAAGDSANGFVLPVGVPVPIEYAGVIWGVATSETATRVSVMAFSYDQI